MRNVGSPTNQFRGRLHHGTARFRTPIGKICKKRQLRLLNHFSEKARTHHHVARQELLPLQHDPGERFRRAEREGTSDAHHESDGEHEAAEDFHDPRIGRVQPCGAALEDLGEQSTEGEHGTGEELSSSDIIVKTSRGMTQVV
jgi:hypothetical protein